MEYTFVAYFKPKSGLDKRTIHELQKQAGVVVHEVPHEELPGSSSVYWHLSVKARDLDEIDAWTDLYRLVEHHAAKRKVLSAGIVFSHAVWLCYGSTLLRGCNSARHMTGSGSFWYQIQSNTIRVPENSVGVFLTAEMNRREKPGPITANQWLEFQAVICKYDRLFRMKKKLDQLRGAGNNPGMFVRLSNEIIKLAEQII